MLRCHCPAIPALIWPLFIVCTYSYRVSVPGLKRVISIKCPNGSTDAVYALTILGLDPVVLQKMIRCTMRKFPAVESEQQFYCYAPRAVHFCKPLLVRMYEAVLSQ